MFLKAIVKYKDVIDTGKYSYLYLRLPSQVRQQVKLVQKVRLLICKTGEVSGLNVGRNSDYPYRGFSLYSSGPPGIFGIQLQSGHDCLRPHPF
jgi:hypothetical protein